MKLQNWILLNLIAVVTSSLIGCNNKSRSSAPPPPACPAGQVATPAGCAPPGGNPPINYIPPNGTGLIQYFASKTDFITGKDTFIPTSNYPLFLKGALGVCDRCQTTVGQALQCDSWVAGFNMLMLSFAGIQPSNTQMAIYSTPYLQQSYYQFAWQFPTIEDFFITLFTGVPAPSCNQGQFSPYWATQMQYESANDGKGFVVYVNQGPFYSQWNLYKFRIYVPVGKIGDNSFNFQFSAIDKNGKSGDLATGTFSRCLNANCGM